MNTNENDQISKSIEAVVQNLGTDLGKAAHDVTDKSSEYINKTRAYVVEKPIRSLIIAASLGLIIGNLMNRISKKS